MASVAICALIILCILLALYQGSLNVDAEVFLVVMEDESVISYKKYFLLSTIVLFFHMLYYLLTLFCVFHRSGDDALKYKEKVITRHDIFLESLLPADSYSKLYSYTHLFNGFALHTTSREVPHHPFNHFVLFLVILVLMFMTIEEVHSTEFMAEEYLNLGLVFY